MDEYWGDSKECESWGFDQMGRGARVRVECLCSIGTLKLSPPTTIPAEEQNFPAGGERRIWGSIFDL